eukprot:gnl/MRDRNA2_/MRDRNA2_98901_c0_seq1.p1 gnl/MRDRNA2_/MRDRNA2_98901_c0~~gnl/MRDRNA2_/MRDRNA2_98901_c0_seq1.p1  ORF type:complete len:372 (+),score=62.91 gnl/MRDRNA2_/MRDRNA2_98901_c0_seq1:68-1183(+)
MELKLEILNAHGLSDGEYRFGDLTSGLLGAKELNPYVVVKLKHQKQQSSPVKGTAAREGNPEPKSWTAAFGWKTIFEVPPGAQQLTFQVFDKKSWQALLRGDPLIGEATLTLPQVLSRDAVEAVVNLKAGNDHEKDTGQLQVRYGLVRPVAFDGTVQWSADPSQPDSGPSVESSGQAHQCPVFSMSSDDASASGDPLTPHNDQTSPDDWTMLPQCDPAPAMERTDSWESFQSADEEERVVDRTMEQCEAIAKRYMEARLSNDLTTLKDLLSSSAVIQIEKPWGGSASYRGWDQCQVYFNDHKAEPGVNFKHWRHSETEVASCTGTYSTVIVRWIGQVYKLGWRSVQSSITVDSQNQIIRIHLVPSVSLSGV